MGGCQACRAKLGGSGAQMFAYANSERSPLGSWRERLDAVDDFRHVQIHGGAQQQSASGTRFVARMKLSIPHAVQRVQFGSSRSLQLRTCVRLLEILSQTQEFPPRREICFSFVQARSSVVEPLVFLGAPIALGNALFHVGHRPLLHVRHRPPVRSDVRFEFGVIASSDCGIARWVPMFPQKS
jgi:hypothetical protein